MRYGAVGSVSLGRWLGMPTRLHVSFILLGGFVLFVAGREVLADRTAHALLLLLIWFSSVVLHEAGHCVAVARLGGSTESISLTPLGGITEHRYLPEPQRQLAAAGGGPLASFAAWFATGFLLFAIGNSSLLELLNPVNPPDLFATDASGAVVALRMAFWINWLILLVNFLPAAPMDGGSALYSLIWPALGVRRATTVVRRTSLMAVVSLCFFSWWLSRGADVATIPAWIPLLGLALMIVCHLPSVPENDEDTGEDDDFFGYDFSQGYTSLETSAEQRPRSSPGLLRRWLVRRRAERESQRIRIEQEEERAVDSILARLHKSGLDSLSQDDRALLQRVSARYRSRTQS